MLCCRREDSDVCVRVSVFDGCVRAWGVRVVQRGNPHCAPPQLKEPSYGFPRRERERHGGRG